MACRVGDTSGQFNFQFNFAVSYKYFQLPVQVVSTNLLNTSGNNESFIILDVTEWMDGTLNSEIYQIKIELVKI